MEVAPERALFGKPAWLALQTDILDRVRKMEEFPSLVITPSLTFCRMTGGDCIYHAFFFRLQAEHHVQAGIYKTAHA